MNRILHLIKKEFIQVFRDKAMIGVIFIVPVVQTILLGYTATTDIKRIPVVISDLDGSADSRELINGLKHSGYFLLDYYDRNPQQVQKYLDSGKAKLAIIIPVNFSSEIRRNRTPDVQILLDGQDSNSSLVALGYVNNILQTFSQTRLRKSALKNPQMAKNIRMVEPEIRVWYNPNLLAKNYMVPGIVVLLLTIVTVILTAMGLVREKEIGTLEQLMVTPIKPYQLMIGKTVPFAVLGFIEITLATTFAKLWYKIPIEGNLGLLALFALVFMFTTLGLGIFISTVSKTQQQAIFMAWFILVFSVILSGLLFPLENMPKSLQYLSYINPVRYFLTVVRELFLKGSGFVDLWREGLIMLVFSTIIITLSSLRFHKRIK